MQNVCTGSRNTIRVNLWNSCLRLVRQLILCPVLAEQLGELLEPLRCGQGERSRAARDRVSQIVAGPFPRRARLCVDWCAGINQSLGHQDVTLQCSQM